MKLVPFDCYRNTSYSVCTTQCIVTPHRQCRESDKYISLMEHFVAYITQICVYTPFNFEFFRELKNRFYNISPILRIFIVSVVCKDQLKVNYLHMYHIKYVDASYDYLKLRHARIHWYWVICTSSAHVDIMFSYRYYFYCNHFLPIFVCSALHAKISHMSL